MLDEYITKQEAIKAVCDSCGVMPDGEKDTCPYKYKGAGCLEYDNIISISPADVRPSIKGKWIKIDHFDSECYDMKCSECETVFEIDGICYLCVKHRLPPFCPNCGADMRDETVVEVEG